MIIDMTHSTKPQMKILEERVVEKGDGKHTLKGLPVPLSVPKTYESTRIAFGNMLGREERDRDVNAMIP